MTHILRSAAALSIAAAGLLGALPALAAGSKVGMSVTVDADGFFLNPVVNKVVVASVEKASLAEGAGIVAGDEITTIEGHVVKGTRASELKPYMAFNAGETRTLQVRHANGDVFEAKITKPKD